MRVDAYERLRCPGCGAKLRLEAFATDEAEGETHVETGVLLCEGCRLAYPIAAETPVMLRFRTPFHDWFAGEHAERLRALDHPLPSGEPRAGEEAVQETFTDEWNLTREDELSFSYTYEQLVDLNRRVWLRSIDRLPEGERPRNVLNVGCGVGMETMVLREVTGADHLFGIDLNFAVLSRRPEFRRQRGIDYVVASLFDLPFERESFDFVYSQGVIHHTYSSADAFRSIATMVRPEGRLFVWVYGLDDHLSPGPSSRWWHRKHHATEWAARPLISRAPRPIRDAIFKLLTLFSHLRPYGGNARLGRATHGDRWTRANTEHALRDWLSPRYAHRHGFNEVTEWFEDGGFVIEDAQSPAAYRELFKVPMFGVGMTGRRLAGSEAEGAEPAAERAHA